MKLPSFAKEDKVQILTNDKFPLLDMKISWSPEGGQQFGIFGQKWTAIQAHRSGKYPHTRYPVLDPIRSLKPPCKTHLAKTLIAFWRGRQNLPRPCKIPPQGSPCTSNFPNNGIIMGKSRWKYVCWEKKEPDVNKKEKHKCLFLSCPFTLVFRLYPQGDQKAKKYFNISWMRVQMSYHIFNRFDELLKGYRATKIGWGILSRDLMDK